MARTCHECVHYTVEGPFCGYCAHICKLGKDLEWALSPYRYYVYDATDCEDFSSSEEPKKPEEPHPPWTLDELKAVENKLKAERSEKQ